MKKSYKADAAHVGIKMSRPLHNRFMRVLAVSRRTRTSVVEEALEKTLPELEKFHGLKAAA